MYSTLTVYRIAGIFQGYKFSRMDHYKGFCGFYFRGLSYSLLANAHINIYSSLDPRPIRLQLNARSPPRPGILIVSGRDRKLKRNAMYCKIFSSSQLAKNTVIIIMI